MFWIMPVSILDSVCDTGPAMLALDRYIKESMIPSFRGVAVVGFQKVEQLHPHTTAVHRFWLGLTKCHPAGHKAVSSSDCTGTHSQVLGLGHTILLFLSL